MAIKFVDKEHEDGKAKTAKAPSVAREPDAKALDKSVEPELSHAKPDSPELPFAKSEPKPRGRKKPLK